MIYIYRVVYLLGRLIAFLFSFLLPEHLRHWFQLRAVQLSQYSPLATPALWFHASSGEVEYVKNIIFEIKKKDPEQKIVLTYSSPSIERLLFNIKDSLDLALPITWDQPLALQELIRIINPKILIFAKTDFWPEMIYQVQKKKIPLGVVSFSLNQKKKPSWAQKWCLQKMNFIFSSDRHTFSALKELGLPVQASSDTRFDQVFFRLAQPTRFKVQFTKPVFVFGSTWPQDDAVLISGVDEIIKQGYQIVWCPHDVSPLSLQNLQSCVSNKNFVIYSKVKDASPVADDILIVDQVGLLADIYRQSEIAFVGGSFKNKIHSVMEPLCAGNIVCFGPLYKNNTEAIEFLGDGLCFQFNSANQLLQWMTTLTQNSKSEIRQKIKQLTEIKKGPSKKIADQLLT